MKRKVKPTLPDSNREWIRTDDARRIFGITRGTLYNLWKSGTVRSAKITGVGDKRAGIRLWELLSIRSAIQAEVEDPPTSLAGIPFEPAANRTTDVTPNSNTK